jgi:hypothetical protein
MQPVLARRSSSMQSVVTQGEMGPCLVIVLANASIAPSKKMRLDQLDKARVLRIQKLCIYTPFASSCNSFKIIVLRREQ